MIGETIAHYRITGELGEGGMGEVYRARDSKLKRDVALKVLPEAFAADPERMTRFQREAEILASLNHPHIAHIYGVEDRALVMELVEGESPKGPLPFEEAWKIAMQIADALEYAHDRGIVHRDLKPSNVKVTPEGVVKLLDFGLAKAFSPDAGETKADARAADSPTLTLSATVAGVVMGTAAYMAPEQAKGKRVDKRADVWSWGVMLYELLMGERLFQGDDAADTLAQVLTKKPDLERVPAKARLVLAECLQKDPKLRLRDIGDAKRLVAESGSEPAGKRSNVWAWIVASVALLLAAVVSFVYYREKPPIREVVRFQIAPPGKGDFGINSIALSPDGKRLVFEAPGPSGATQLWVRSLDSVDAKPLAGTENPLPFPFWSPDSRFIGFATPGKLNKVEASGGSVLTLCDWGGASFFGGSWNREGVIVFGTPQGLVRVPETGGATAPLTTLDMSGVERRHYGPAFLPDGHHFLYLRGRVGFNGSVLKIRKDDKKPYKQIKTQLTTSDSVPAYSPVRDSDIGRLLFVREGSLMAQAFNAGKLALVGQAVPIAEGLQRLRASPFSVSTNGVLAYRTASHAGLRKLTWFDREGNALESAGEPGEYNSLSLAPDGSRVAVSRTDANNTDIWLYEFSGGRATRFTSDPGTDWLAVWSPDGSRIVFSSTRDRGMNLYQKASSGAENEQTLLKSNEVKFAQDWSPDGQFLLYSHSSVFAGSDMALSFLPLKGDAKSQPYLRTGFNDSQGRFSPNGHFIAYTSNASGKNEVYVQPFPDSSTGKWPVSKGGGVQPRWRRDGKELFYLSADSKMMAVDVTTSPTFRAGVPKPLFSAPIWGGGSVAVVTRYDVTADGKKFLINAVSSEGGGVDVTPITIVLNWEALLKR